MDKKNYYKNNNNNSIYNYIRKNKISYYGCQFEIQNELVHVSVFG